MYFFSICSIFPRKQHTTSQENNTYQNWACMGVCQLHVITKIGRIDVSETNNMTIIVLFVPDFITKIGKIDVSETRNMNVVVFFCQSFSPGLAKCVSETHNTKRRTHRTASHAQPTYFAAIRASSSAFLAASSCRCLSKRSRSTCFSASS